MVDFTRGRVPTDEVLFARDGRLGRVLLNRPRQINSLTEDMCLAMATQLQAWAEDDAVAAVSIEGAGEKGLCAGGDVVAVRAVALTGESHPTGFWDAEYALDAYIHDYPKPVLSIQDGIVMGGGVGISAYADLRLTTERSRVAMPETIIGFFPDVGALYLLAQAPGEVGAHLAMTGATMTGADAVAIGVSDALVEAAELPGIIAAVAESGELDDTVGNRAPFSPLLAQRTWIDECYGGNDPVAIVERLKARTEPEAQAAAEAIEARSPLAVAVSLEALRRARDLPSAVAVLQQDSVVAANFLSLPSDFAEGVRALLVDKDKNPTWRHTALADVTRDEVEAFFVRH